MRTHLLFSDLYRCYRHILPQLMSPEPSTPRPQSLSAHYRNFGLTVRRILLMWSP